MRAEDAVYGGEMSAHHYFREFSYCDSGMIPWLLICELMSVTGQTLSELVRERMEKFPVSGEINRRLEDPVAKIAEVKKHFRGGGQQHRLDRWAQHRVRRLALQRAFFKHRARGSVECRVPRRH